VASVDDVPAVDVSAGVAAEVSAGAVLFIVAVGSVLVLGVALVSLDWAIAAPMPASRAAAAAATDSFFW
jgi:hypothetical protein